MLKIKPFRQSPAFCGPASLKMILAYYGLKKSEKELAKMAGASRIYGTKAVALLKTAKKLGFKGMIKDFTKITDLKKCLVRKIPAIVAWFSEDESHYSVVVGFDRKNIFLADPEIGRIRKMEIKKFKRIWFDFRGDFLKSKKDIIIRRMILIRK